LGKFESCSGVLLEGCEVTATLGVTGRTIDDDDINFWRGNIFVVRDLYTIKQK